MEFLKPRDSESYESWAERVRMYEQGHAMMQIAQGKDPEKVMEEMSRRIMDKLLHPIFKAIQKSANTELDVKNSAEHYKELMAKRGPVADHVDTNS